MYNASTATRPWKSPFEDNIKEVYGYYRIKY